MKHLLPAALLLASLPAAAQTPRSAAKLNVAGLALRSASVFYEHRLNERRSLSLGVLAPSFRSSSSGTVVLAVKGFAVTSEYRFYFAPKALNGWFVGPYARLQRYNLSNTNTVNFGTGSYVVVDRARLVTVGGGVVGGWKKQFGARLCLEPFVRVGYAAGKVDNLDDEGSLDISFLRGLELLPGLSVGYLFGQAK